MFCRHKYGKIEDGYQHCTKCNKAIVVPCNHKWIKQENIHTRNGFGNVERVQRVLQCSTCGDMKTVVLSKV